MCGIVGLYGPGLKLIEGRKLDQITSTLDKRGPDGQRGWIDRDAHIYFGHSRLSVLDLTDTGAQPMLSPCGRYTLTFNGEIYNHLSLRRELLSLGKSLISFAGTSDSETLLVALSVWGVEETLKKCRGMFAFGLWDSLAKVLTIARDRIGEKPIYYGYVGQGMSRTFMFASDLRAFKQHPQFDGCVDRLSLQAFLKYGYVPDPASIYAGVKKLMPGTVLRVSKDIEIFKVQRYWDLESQLKQPRIQTQPMSEQAMVQATDNILAEAVSHQMLSDVPIGAFLSGGIDSSTVVALMQRNSMKRVKSFTVGFLEDRYNEADIARKVAEHLGTEHTEITVTPQQVREVIPLIPDMYSEPFGDSSQLPTYLIARLARESVTVCLSGDGGDEIFCGYERYRLGKKAWQLQRSIPQAARSLLSACILSIDQQSLNRWVPGSLLFGGVSLPGQKLHKAASAMKEKTFVGVFENLISHHDSSLRLVIDDEGTMSRVAQDFSLLSDLEIEENMMLWDTTTYLPGDILVKVDRAAMHCSLETRAPFLDHEVVSHAWSMPLDMKLRKGTSKWVLREVLKKYVPAALFDRPKMGFGVPLGAWLRGPLKDWACSLLNKDLIREQGFLCADSIEALWTDHLYQNRDHSYVLWNILMFQAWLANE